MSENGFLPKGILKNGHVNTIWPNLFRVVNDIGLTRKRIELPDGDFVDIDIKLDGRNTCVLIMHGLEGNSKRPYMLGMAKRCWDAGHDVILMNHRSCSEEPNRILEAYHSGKTIEVELILNYVNTQFDYENIAIVSFSMSGNMALKYAGDPIHEKPKVLKAIVAISTPCDLTSSVYQLEKGFNRVYMRRFIKTLKQKAAQKLETFPEAPYTLEEVRKTKTFRDIDEYFTARVYGFKSALDYWQKSSCKPYISNIDIPTLILNAQDDPFLAPECYPVQECASNNCVELEMPKYGGHVGFVGDLKMETTYAEERVVEFLASQLIN
ncbi:MAG: alpha/beta fold hydrolase [Bacteroidia bacterium]